MLIDSEGNIRGLASVYNVLDSHRDIVAPGAYAQTIAEHRAAGTLPRMLAMHALGKTTEDQLPVGRWVEMRDTPDGLYMEGRLATGNRRADDLAALIRNGSLTGLSVGYIARKYTLTGRSSGPRRILDNIDLRETSLVDQPSNDKARLQAKRVDPGDKFLVALSRLVETQH